MESEQHQGDTASEMEAPPQVGGEPKPPVLEHEEVMHPTNNDIGYQVQHHFGTEHEEAVHPSIDDQIEDQSRPAVYELEEVVQPTTNDVDNQGRQHSETERGSIPPALENDAVGALQVTNSKQDDVVHPTTNYNAGNQDQHQRVTERDNVLSASEDDSEDIILPVTSGQDGVVHGPIVHEANDATPERPRLTSASVTGVEDQHQTISVGSGEAAPASDADLVPRTGGGEQQQQFAITINEDAVRSSAVNVDLATSPAPTNSHRTLKPIPLSLHDAAIECVCPPGTTRLAKDIAFTGATKAGPRWIHVPCKSLTAELSPEEAAEFKAKVKDASAAYDPLKHMTRQLGHAPYKKQRLFLKHFTSTFRCDGPCDGPKSTSDWILCQKCCAWQHKPCMLYGDRRDRGGPVCNRCYMSFLLHRDEIVAWQRRRLLEAVKQGWIYLNNPENCHQQWRRAWIRRWLARFFEHNQVVFQKYCVARYRAERLTAAQAYYSRVKVMPQVGEIQPTHGQLVVGAKKGDGQAKRRTSIRKQPERKKAPNEARLIEPDDDPGNGPEASNAADSDEIVVASSAKNKSKAKVKPAARLARSTGKKAIGKRRASSSVSPSPLSKRIRPTKSRAPRKSAPTFGRFDASMSGEDSGDNEKDKDEASDPEEMIVRRGRLPTAASQTTISCRCPGKAPTARDCFKCRDCGMHQHYACANDVKDGLSVVCNFCHVRSPMQSPVLPPKRQPKFQGIPHANRPPMPNPTRPQPAPAPSQQAAQLPQQYDPALQDEVNHLCITVLWREYCSIPMPNEDEPATNPATGPAAPDWLAECQVRLMSLLTSAGQQQTTKYLAPALAAWPRQNHQIMKALRELAIEEIFYGSFRKKRKQLGLVLEVLGLEEKGSVWKSNA